MSDRVEIAYCPACLGVHANDGRHTTPPEPRAPDFHVKRRPKSYHATGRGNGPWYRRTPPEPVEARDLTADLVVAWRAFSDRFMDPAYRDDPARLHTRDAFAAGWDAALRVDTAREDTDDR